MYDIDRANAHRTLAVLDTIDHPMKSFQITGQFVPMRKVWGYQDSVREALEILGATDADNVPAPGRMAVAGARQRIGNAVKFLAQYGL